MLYNNNTRLNAQLKRERERERENVNKAAHENPCCHFCLVDENTMVHKDNGFMEYAKSRIIVKGPTLK